MKMMEGKTIYYVPSLHELPIAGKVIKTESFKDRITWIEIETKTGNRIADYANKFSASKPKTQYTIIQNKLFPGKYAEFYFCKASGKKVSIENLYHSFELYHVKKMTFDQYMNQLVKSSCFVACEK